MTRARILKHLLEAEKSTFRNELSFQRSESTTGFVKASVFVKLYKRLFYINFNRSEKWSKSYNYCLSFIIKNLIKLNRNPVLALSAVMHFKMFKNSASGKSPDICTVSTVHTVQYKVASPFQNSGHLNKKGKTGEFLTINLL